jgi:iron(III) transport system ATP-binding protein
MSSVTIENISKRFNQVTAVDGLSLDIREGEFVSLLGPSGCGKTTTLRMLAGFEYPDNGRILFDGRDMTLVKANQRNTGMVFQNFALFPHMTVFENVAFGLLARRVDKTVVRAKVRDALVLVDLQNLGERRVNELSGGQQQRVALARAVVIEPNILLLDEPLSNLDAKLREETRTEIRALQQRLAITTIYVTHDQDEALALSDRIAVMQQGVCQQFATPEEVYNQPANAFVARFVGNSNILEGCVSRDQAGTYLKVAQSWLLPLERQLDGHADGAKIVISLRPEGIDISETRNDLPEGIIRHIRRSGALVEYEISVHDVMLRSRRLATVADFHRKAGTRVGVHVPPAQITILTKV